MTHQENHNNSQLLIHLDLPIANNRFASKLTGLDTRAKATTQQTHRVCALLEHRHLKPPVKTSTQQRLSNLNGERIKLTLTDGLEQGATQCISRTVPLGMLPTGYRPTLWMDVQSFHHLYAKQLHAIQKADVAVGPLNKLRLAVWMQQGLSLSQAMLRCTMLHQQVVQWNQQMRESAREITFAKLMQRQSCYYNGDFGAADAATSSTLH